MRPLVLLAVASFVLALPHAALSKGDVRVELLAPLPADAEPGETVAVSWRLVSTD